MLGKQDLIDFERSVADAWEAGKIKAPLHLSGGNESQLIEIFKEIKPHDYVFSGHRNHSHSLLHGSNPTDVMREILGEGDAKCMGRARSMGYIDHDLHLYSSAIVAGCCAIAVGVAWALKAQWDADHLSIEEHASRRHVWCFVGDGAVDEGHFWEALKYARGWHLPITFVVEDNNRATCTDWDSRNGPESRHFTRELIQSGYIKYYYYTPSWPHVGTGTYVQF